MIKNIRWVTLLSIVLLTACVSTLPTQDKERGRYFVMIDPLTGEPGVQFSYPSVEGCQHYARSVADELVKQGLSGRCSETSVTDSLRAAAVLKNTASDVLIGINAKTVRMCQVFVKAATFGENAEIVEVVSACAHPYSLK